MYHHLQFAGLAAEAEKNVAAKNETVQNLSNAVEAGKSGECSNCDYLVVVSFNVCMCAFFLDYMVH